MISLLGSNVSILHKVHIKNCQRITLIKEIQYLESIVRLLKKFNFTKQISAFVVFFSLKADIFLYFGETNTVIKLSRNPKQKYCYFKDSSSSHSQFSGGRGIITEVTSCVCCVTLLSHNTLSAD